VLIWTVFQNAVNVKGLILTVLPTASSLLTAAATCRKGLAFREVLGIGDLQFLEVIGAAEFDGGSRLSV
jgi:hypothetical protein